MKQHASHFILLAVILGVGVLGFFRAQGDSATQLVIGVMTSLSYIIWGIVHHALEHDLHPKVVIEYVLIGAVAIVLLLLFLGTV